MAIKRLLPRYNEDEEFITMLADEARITAELSHPNIAQVYEFGVVDGQHVLAMGVPGGRRSAVAAAPLPRAGAAHLPTLAVYIVEQALRGLHYAHTRSAPTGSR
ncbi:MAG: hypothetical protein R3F43_27310 [bacterium]